VAVFGESVRQIWTLFGLAIAAFIAFSRAR
jgi:hypothetical protein